MVQMKHLKWNLTNMFYTVSSEVEMWKEKTGDLPVNGFSQKKIITLQLNFKQHAPGIHWIEIKIS